MRGRRYRQGANFADGNPEGFAVTAASSDISSYERLQFPFNASCAAQQMPIRDEKADSRLPAAIPDERKS